LLPWPPDIVVSGINRGSNMGQDITYSGTVTAALEAAIQGVKALSVSLANRDANSVEDYEEAARVAVQVVQKSLEKDLPSLTILNLNIPPCNRVRGIRLTRQGVRIYQDELANEGNLYRIEGPEPTGNYEEEGTDVWAVHNNYASLTPIHLDMTAHRFIADIAAWDITV
jgi:5'-nucleotidase